MIGPMERYLRRSSVGIIRYQLALALTSKGKKMAPWIPVKVIHFQTNVYTELGS